MMSYEECPEFQGPQSEGNLFGADYGQPGYPSIGRAPRQMPIEMMERERAQAAEAYERRLRVERAAFAISLSTLEGGKLADQIMEQIASAGEKAVKS